MDADPPEIVTPADLAAPSSSEAVGTARPGGTWGLQRGESIIAGMALATLVLLLVTLGIGASLTAHSHKQDAENARREQLRAVTDLLARNCESLLASGQISTLRRSLVEMRAQNGLERCRVILPDGRVIADSLPSGITQASLPEKWPSGPLDARESADMGEALRVRSLLIPGRGPATLELKASMAGSGGGPWDLLTTLGLLGAIAVLVHWLVYRHLRKRVLALGMIREALGAFGSGERTLDVLALSPSLGPEVRAWNDLMGKCQDVRRQAVSRDLRDKLERRQEARSELELACDSLSVGLAIIDEQGLLRHANGAVASLLKVRREEIGGKPLIELMSGDQNARLAVEALIAGKSMQRRTWELTIGGEGAVSSNKNAPGESSVLRITLRPMRREDSCAALLTLEDITQQRVAQASRSAFVAQATHELRTPLTNMRLCVESALEEPESDPAAIGKCLNMINGEIRRLERMVSEMLSVAEIEAGSLKLHGGDVRLDALFERLRGEVEPMAEQKQIKLAFDLPPKFPVIYGDIDKLVLALHNLIGNAIKYTPAGGQVTISMRADGKRITVEVADTGIGVRPEEQERIFDRFYRAKDPRVSKITGTGLGLALSREVARIHGGDVTVQSEIDKGSTFTLTVPLGKAA